MTERDIRKAFQHLEEDVMNHVQTEERLEQITKQRRWARPQVWAFAGAYVAVLVAVGIAFMAFRGDSDPAPVPPVSGQPSVAPTTVPDTSAPDTTGAPDTVAPPSALPELVPGTVVIADPTAAAAGPITDGTVVFDAAIVVGDGAGGVFVQLDASIGWLPADGPGVTLLDPTFTGGDGETVELRLEDVAVIDGDVNVIFIVAGGVEEQRYEEVWRYDVATATPIRIYRTGAYEGGIRRASLQNDILVVTRAAEGFSWFEFVGVDGRLLDVTNPHDADAAAGFPLTVDQGVLSPDGSTFVFLESDSPAAPEDNNWKVDLVVWDMDRATEDRRMQIELGNWLSGRMDYDGRGIVLGRTQWNGDSWVAGPALQVTTIDAADATATELDAAGSPSLIKLTGE